MNVAVIALHFAEQLERSRALTSEESAMLFRVVKYDQSKPARTWTPQDDHRLLWLSARGTTATKIARIMRRTPGAIRTRRRDLRKKEMSGG